MDIKKKKIVSIAGGNGSAITLRALKKHKDVFDISAVVGTSDSGGSSGKLREELAVLPPGDILRAVLSMSAIYDYDTFLKPLFYKKRFYGLGRLNEHNLGNLFLVLASKYSGDFVKSIRALEQIVEAAGSAYPSTLELADLVAELENGEIIKTEAMIDRPVYDKSLKIKKVYLGSKPNAYPDVLKVIEEADYILFGPGSLYCSIIAAILPEGISDSISKSSAKLIYIASNKYELDGETGPVTLCKSLWALEEYLPRKIDSVVFNTNKLNPKQRSYYDRKRWGLVEYNPEHIKSTKVVGGNFEKENGGLDVEKLGDILKSELV